MSTGIASANATALVGASNKHVVNTVPDYVPAAAVAGTTDLGLKLLRSHYQQKDGSNPPVLIGGACVNFPERGGDMGGMIIPTAIGVTTSKQCQLVQSSDEAGGLDSALRK